MSWGRKAAVISGGLYRVDALAKSAAVLCITILLCSCGVTSGQLEAAATFGKSATALADGVKTAYTQAAQDEANIRTAKFTVLNRFQNFAPTDISKGTYKTSLIKLGPKDIAGRYAAADALTAYGQALTTLLDAKSQEGDLASATDKLTAALKGIPSKTLTQAHVTTSEINDIGQLITAFGNIYLDYRRREVLELVIPKAEPIVTKICSMFGRDFDSNGGIFATIYMNTLDSVIENTEVSLTNSTKVPDANYANGLQQRAILLSIYQQMSATKAKVEVSFGSLNDAAKSCSKSSIALAQSIKDPTLTIDDITDFAAKAQAAYNAVAATAGKK